MKQYEDYIPDFFFFFFFFHNCGDFSIKKIIIPDMCSVWKMQTCYMVWVNSIPSLFIHQAKWVHLLIPNCQPSNLITPCLKFYQLIGLTTCNNDLGMIFPKLSDSKLPVNH